MAKRKYNSTTPNQILVSPQDSYVLESRVWTIRRGKPGHTSYAIARVGGRMTFLHVFIMQPIHGLHVDHVNGNGLDNRRENLRIVSHSQNMQNARSLRGASRFKGVAKHNNTSKWRAYISIARRQIHLGMFDTEIAAARAYNAAALAHFGKYAKLNEC
jgi:hypothetical protein